MEDIERDRETGGARVREGDPDELVVVMRVLDAGLLEADTGETRDRLATGDCLVTEASGRVVGALASGGDYIEAVTVSPSRRGRGVGIQPARTALDRRDRLVVDLDRGVKSFYESLGFDIGDRSDDEGRFRGVPHDE